jgi:hypothetical protein
LWLFGPSIERK